MCRFRAIFRGVRRLSVDGAKASVFGGNKQKSARSIRLRRYLEGKHKGFIKERRVNDACVVENWVEV